MRRIESLNDVGNSYNTYESKQTTTWKDLDDNDFNNHFLNGQCGVGVIFNTTSSTGAFDKWINLPIYPEDVTFSGSTNYNSAEIIGRPGTISGYISTSDVTSRFNLHMHRELLVPGEIVTDRNKIDEIIAFMQACDYPKNDGGLKVPIVTYVFGDTQIVGKQTGFNTKWSGTKIGNSYMEVNIDISITHTPNHIIYYDDIKGYNPRQFK